MALEAGSALDALIAAKVMGLEVKPYESLNGAGIRERFGEPWTPILDNLRGTPSQQWKPVPHYSTDIGAAWEVVEKVADGDWIWFHLAWEGKRFRATFRGTAQGMPTHEVTADAAPHAICLAALRACGVEP